ncbi:hypothetical protein SDC9_178698 [bioreactor metagenome]|uniref:Uncharacterized protein n=1 Tax=bioreactor metagenome TaxID=1076179 RepID=A0A645H4F5_9ZZZZ
MMAKGYAGWSGAADKETVGAMRKGGCCKLIILLDQFLAIGLMKTVIECLTD